MIAFASARLDEKAAEARFVHLIDCSQAFVSPEHCDCDCGYPAHVLREVEAMREIVTVALKHAATVDGEWGDCHDAAEIAAGKCPDHGARAARRGLAPLVSIWSDHPDYREEWAA
jgi:hypothetical protein